MKAYASKHGGKCLSTKYEGASKRLQWECHARHKWYGLPGSMRSKNSWCAKCAGLVKKTISEMNDIAAKRGGKCLSTIYRDKGTKLLWECKKRHTWSAVPASIYRLGTWCPKCAHYEKLTLSEMQALAQARGGKCLSTTYSNSSTCLKWECKKGHSWDATPTSVKHAGTWCSKCAKCAKLSITEMQELAHSHGGECLSDTYNSCNENLKWKCKRGHKWDATPTSVKHAGTWCPQCPYKNESECREIFEKLTNKSFDKCRPKWLDGLELDGYNKELGLAFEYHGRQHATFVSHFHRNGEIDLEKQKEHDIRKQELCDKNNVTLITIWFNVPKKEQFIRSELYYLRSDINCFAESNSCSTKNQ
jgi:hypothetical protein